MSAFDMSLETWLLFVVTEAVICFTPGPAVLLVLSLSLTRGADAGLRGAFGILAGNAMYFFISATSLGAMLLASWELFTAVKWAGALYLVWRGIAMILSPGTALPDPGQAETFDRRGAIGPFGYGFLTQGANPKALVFFAAILPQFVDPTRGFGSQLLILGVTSIVIELVVLGFYVALAQRTRGLVRHRFARPLERAAGGLLVAAGARLATTARG
jgi:homoserine/homoserine lactone efflux protein